VGNAAYQNRYKRDDRITVSLYAWQGPVLDFSTLACQRQAASSPLLTVAIEKPHSAPF